MSFNSFDEIRQNSIRIFDVIDDKYLAHISDKKDDESLKEHSILVSEYLSKINKSQNIESIVENAIDSLFLLLNISGGNEKNYCKSIFFDSIILHDLGKINPNFQVDRMHNALFENEKLIQKYYHSFLGSFIFSNFYFDKILKDETIVEEHKSLLYFFVLLMSFPISKHHASFLSFEKEFGNEILAEAYLFIKHYSINLEEDVSISFFECLEDIMKEVQEKKPSKINFIFFSLLKLSYSLLTACDYYATNEYMADMRVDEFGILDENLKQQIVSNFASLQPYNRELVENIEHYNTMPFSLLKERNRQNLNRLRQKLNAEVISTLRGNPDNNWYYIEAPTGAGKTNLSLACIAELLTIDKSLNKVFYVFPFTTLITQTFQGIQDTIGLTNDEIIQLHSKAGFHEKHSLAAENDAQYGSEKRLYLDNLFVNYQFCVTSHVRFFEILKGNSKEVNYMHHRLCNSIVVIDELQTYNPKHWDKLLFFIENYAPLFNMRFIIMSATLPKIDALSETAKGKFVSLTPNKHDYFTNDNFAGRIEFDFSLLNGKRPDKEKKEAYLMNLASFMGKEGEAYFNKHGKSRLLIEFITKNTASEFFRIASETYFKGYKLFIISGDILEPQRKIIINELKEDKYDKILVVSTQVVEAGVDIDMDLGFKDRSLLDSDEQLAGRINRNASKNDCKVFLFDCDSSVTIYGKDKRYEQQQKDKEIYFGFKEILRNKTFDKLYEKVFEDALKPNWADGDKLDAYLQNFERLDFKNINNEFKLIEDNNSEQLYIPLEIDITSDDDIDYLKRINVITEAKKISGEKLFEQYINLITNKQFDFTLNQIELKKLTGLMSRFTISVYPKIINEISSALDEEKGQYGYRYFSHWEENYKLETGFDMQNVKNDIFL